MKRIALYDRYRLNEDCMPENRRNMISDYKKIIMEEENAMVDSFFDDCSELIPLNERAGYSELYEKCKAGAVDEVRVISMSRISRNLTWIVDMCDKMKQLGIKVYFVKEGTTIEQLVDPNVIQSFEASMKQSIVM